MYSSVARNRIAKLSTVDLEALLAVDDIDPDVEEAIYSELESREMANIEEWYSPAS